MSVTLTDQDRSTLRTAAYGAVSLMSAAAAGNSAHRAATDGSNALTSATGLVGHVLAARSRDIRLPGRTVAALAEHVLPALTAGMRLLGEQSPEEAGNFRTTVLVAVDAAARPRRGEPGPAVVEMARKITAALDAA